MNVTIANSPMSPTPPLEILRSRVAVMNDRAEKVIDILAATSTRMFGSPKEQGISGNNPTPTPVPNGHIEAMSDAIERLEHRLAIIENYSSQLDSAV